MAIDTKAVIAEAAAKLLVENKTKKLTVKDIVQECRMTRQAFYYHFDGIPDLLDWVLQRQAREMLSKMMEKEDAEEALRYFIEMTLLSRPYFEKGLATNYRTEMERILKNALEYVFDHMMSASGLYADVSRRQFDIIRKYHIGGILGVLHEWNEENTKNIDEIVRLIIDLFRSGSQ
ncbi:MAG: TetR family transcriptional regulator [Tissierellia bacterium]|jgi:AcrR family transcriptional regulator|nr:TetR family transcriptional regulator [Tissierellia bacterium]